MKNFAESTFNPTTKHNARFTKKSFNLDLASLNALSNYFENGGTIKVNKSAKRPAKGYTVSKVKITKG